MQNVAIVQEVNAPQQNIAGVLNAYMQIKFNLKTIVDEIKKMEKNDSDEYIELKKAESELKKQLKEMKDDHEKNLKSDDQYNQLRIKRLELEENLALKREDLLEKLEKFESSEVQMSFDFPDIGDVHVVVDSRKCLFLNGKEEKLYV